MNALFQNPARTMQPALIWLMDIVVNASRDFKEKTATLVTSKIKLKEPVAWKFAPISLKKKNVKLLKRK